MIRNYILNIVRPNQIFLNQIQMGTLMIEYIEKKTNCKVGENSADGLFTIKAVECLGACGYAPMLQLGDSFVEHLTEEKVDSLISELRNK